MNTKLTSSFLTRCIEKRGKSSKDLRTVALNPKKRDDENQTRLREMKVIILEIYEVSSS